DPQQRLLPGTLAAQLLALPAQPGQVTFRRRYPPVRPRFTRRHQAMQGPSFDDVVTGQRDGQLPGRLGGRPHAPPDFHNGRPPAGPVGLEPRRPVPRRLGLGASGRGSHAGGSPGCFGTHRSPPSAGGAGATAASNGDVPGAAGAASGASAPRPRTTPTGQTGSGKAAEVTDAGGTSSTSRRP